MNVLHHISIELLYPDGRAEVYDNDGSGIVLPEGAQRIEVGELPINIRYADYNKMFNAAATIVLEYCEEVANVTVRTLDGSKSDTKILGGSPGHESVGVFRLYDRK